MGYGVTTELRLIATYVQSETSYFLISFGALEEAHYYSTVPPD